MTVKSLRTQFWELRQLLGGGLAFRRQAQQLMADDRRKVVDYLFSFKRGPFIVGPRQVPSELARLFEVMVELRPQVVAELGTNLGGTLCLEMLALRQPGLGVSVDLPSSAYGTTLHRWQAEFLWAALAGPRKRLAFIRDDSHKGQVAEQVRSLVAPYGGIDFLMIDGDHTYQGVKQDWECYAPLVRAGGLVAFHDILPHPAYPEVQVDRFWNELKARVPAQTVQEIIEDPGQGWAGIGLVTIGHDTFG